MSLAAETALKSTKGKREVLCPELESALLKFILQYERDGPIRGELLQEKARKLYSLLYPTNEISFLKSYNGWLSGFKARHGIQEYKRHGESRSADVNAIEQQRLAFGIL